MTTTDKLDKSKCYCNQCFKSGKITELNNKDTNNVNNVDGECFDLPSCGHKGRYFSYLKWCEECDDFTSRRGFSIQTICYRCVMKTNCKTAIDKGKHSCQNPETSLSNKELHKKTIESQIKNGTFNMMNPKIHAKATKAKMANYASGNYKCAKCGEYAVLSAWGLCSKCQSQHATNNAKDKYCDVCGKETRHNGYICCICHPESDVLGRSSFTVKNNVRFYKGIEVEEFASKILSGELNIDDYPNINIRCGRVCYGAEDILTSDKIIFTANFIERNGVKYYKGIEIHELIRQLDSGEIKIPPRFNKRFGEWHYQTENILTGEIAKLNGSLFEERDNVLYFLDKSTGKYIDWENYKTKFTTFNINFELPEGFKMYPTFLTEDCKSESVGGAFEQSLVENNISWFAYIKFDELNRPLVAGKSGSKLVNDSGSDVCFSKNIEHGPSRRFLQENNLDWCKTQIAICPCETEQEAYKLEQKILKGYNLFGS